MGVDAATRRSIVSDDEDDARRDWRQSAIPSDFRRQACFAIDGRQHRLHVGDDGLDLDDEDDSVGRMPRENVDRSALASNPEGRFNDDVPTGGAKNSRNALHDRRMRCVKQAVECLAVVAEPKVDPG